MLKALLIAMSIIHTAFRLAYFFYIGFTLRATASRELGVNGRSEWLRFKSKASFILNADGITLMLVVLLSIGSLQIDVPLIWILIAGFLMMAAGVAVKAASYRVVGREGYYWYNFFCEDGEQKYVAKGIYKYIENPMYTLGYLHAFGFALFLRSAWGLCFAAFDVLILWAFHRLFEKPHTERHRLSDLRIEIPRDLAAPDH